MVQKYFPLDKNYILEEAQLLQQERLICFLIDFAKDRYQLLYNPLGIEDAPIRQIKAHTTIYTERLEAFYRNLCGIYRYHYGQNQLEFLFDGLDHAQRYALDWETTYKEWLEAFCLRPNFLKAVLELTVFYPEGRKAELAGNRMNAFLQQHFELKIYRYRGIVKC